MCNYWIRKKLKQLFIKLTNFIQLDQPKFKCQSHRKKIERHIITWPARQLLSYVVFEIYSSDVRKRVTWSKTKQNKY